MAATAAIQIGELSRRTSCNIETIRYYERIGLLPVPPRRGRYRSYGREDVARLASCAVRGSWASPLTRCAPCSDSRPAAASCTEVRELAASHLQDVRARIADLRRMERVLADSVRACDAGQDPGCPLLDALGAEVRAA
jgi:MerR family mercuric resistance operon transcriptional regulator